MYKKAVLSAMGLLLLLIVPSPHLQAENEKPKPSYTLIQDTLITALTPYLNQAVNDYYKEFKQFSLWDARILEIKRLQEGGYDFNVKLMVQTFEHAHSPPYGKETITLNVSPFGVKVIGYQHQGDEWEKRIHRFYQDALTDLIQAFDLKLQTFTFYRYGQLLYRVKEKSLIDIVRSIQANIINKEITPPEKNVINPVTYIKGDQAYILFKLADGTNVLYVLQKEKNIWKVMEQKKKPGKKMKKELLWYM
ncbi:DUF3888 domain-containing protein [Thermoflavimicrobium dichotomicum]|uniref:DUF3888 domain-containing protein n=1 Tax=Thermoflavimicrobium dichotomicum TaxID=46223 RepID=A0A1I3PM36_9BACL|nr:DUF3888 domain-containing protein [Thermoflavimicrobium dichotomicum]SFJ22572.1 Protein of unknown function [Thermoflavimicrobium dichotomicum]